MYPGDPTPTPPSNPQPYGYCRQDKHVEYLKGMWMKDVSFYEEWLLGGPEIKLQILAPIGATGNNGATIVDPSPYSMSRGAIEDFWYCDTMLYYWEKALTSDAVKYVWIEKDWGIEADIKTTLEYTDKTTGLKATIEVSYKKATFDDEISVSTMNFELCPASPATGMDYYTGGTAGSGAFRWLLESKM